MAEQPSDRDDREDEPLAEHDAVDCEASATECDIKGGARDGTATDAEASLRDEVDEAYKPEPLVMILDPKDGLPVPAGERFEPAKAHPFTIDTVVCVEDERVFVELFREELLDRGWVFERANGSCEEWQAPCGSSLKLAYSKSRFTDDGRARIPGEFEPADVEARWGVLVVNVAGSTAVPPLWLPVRPRRERCAYYKRQVMANDDVPAPDEPGHFIIFRNCTMRKSVGGAFMTLRDEAVYSCDYRDPPDPVSADRIDRRDRERLSGKRHLDLVPLFNLSDGE